MDKGLSNAAKAAEKVAKKLTSVSVGRGKTAFPKAPKDLENIGVRLDFDGEVAKNGTVFNKFQMQPNAGKIPSVFRDWRDKNGGTHAVMGSLYVKKGGDVESVREGFDAFREEFKKKS